MACDCSGLDIDSDLTFDELLSLSLLKLLKCEQDIISFREEIRARWNFRNKATGQWVRWKFINSSKNSYVVRSLSLKLLKKAYF